MIHFDVIFGIGSSLGHAIHKLGFRVGPCPSHDSAFIDQHDNMNLESNEEPIIGNFIEFINPFNSLDRKPYLLYIIPSSSLSVVREKDR